MLLCAAVLVAVGGLPVSADAAPLLGVPLTVMLLLYIRGLYRTRLRALILDGLIPLLSAVSVATLAMAMVGVFFNGSAPGQDKWIKTWLFASLAICLGRVLLSYAQRYARRKKVIGKPVLIMGAGIVGSQVARRLDSHPEYGLRPIGFLMTTPARSRRWAAARCRSWGRWRTSTAPRARPGYAT